jgi:hypothetical protein
MESMMQALQQMSRQQMAMNMLTQQMMEQMMQNGGRMTPDMRGQMGRMADEEERLAENLRRMLQNEPGAISRGHRCKRPPRSWRPLPANCAAAAWTPTSPTARSAFSRVCWSAEVRSPARVLRKRQAETSKTAGVGKPRRVAAALRHPRRRALLDEGYKTYPAPIRM